MNSSIFVSYVPVSFLTLKCLLLNLVQLPIIDQNKFLFFQRVQILPYTVTLFMQNVPPPPPSP